MDRQMVEALRREIYHATGRTYEIKLDGLDALSVRELLRLVRDMRYDKMAAIRRAQYTPWRR